MPILLLPLCAPAILQAPASAAVHARAPPLALMASSLRIDPETAVVKVAAVLALGGVASRLPAILGLSPRLARFMVLPAGLALGVVAVAPTAAIEALIIALLLWAFGAAGYWPINMITLCIGFGGIIGCLHGVLEWNSVRAERKRRRLRGERGAPPPRSEPVDDGSGGLVALLISALVASVVGALP